MTSRIHIALLLSLSVLAGGACSRDLNPTSGGHISISFSTGELQTKVSPGDGSVSDGGGIVDLGNGDGPDIRVFLANGSGEVIATYPSNDGDTYPSECTSFPDATESTIQFDSPGLGTYYVYVVANAGWLSTGSGNPRLSAAIPTAVTSPATTISDLESLTLSRNAALSFSNVNPMPLSAKGSISLVTGVNGQIDLELKRVVSRVSLTFDNKTDTQLKLYGCTVTLKVMDPLGGYLFPMTTDYVTRGQNDQDDLVLCSSQDITISASGTFDLTPRLVFPSVAPTQSEGGRMYLCDICFTMRYPIENVEYNENNPSTYTTTTYNNENLPVQDLENYENILALTRNQDLTIVTEINRRDQDRDITFNFRIKNWTDTPETVVFH